MRPMLRLLHEPRRRLICAIVGHRWGDWHFAPLNRYGTTHARFCERCPERQIAKRSTEGLIYWHPRCTHG